MKLFVFGCSNSASYHTETLEYQQYKEFRMGVFPPTWSELLANKLNCELCNYAIPGSGNDSIRTEFVKNIININEDDIVIIGWTFIERYMWINTIENKWNHHSYEHSENMDIKIDTHQEIVFNRSHKFSNYLIIEHIYEWMNMINYISIRLNFKVYYWSCDGRILSQYDTQTTNNSTVMNKYGSEFWDRLLIKKQELGGTIFDYVKKYNGKKIIEETNGLVKDHHWGESGHKVLSESFYNRIIGKVRLI